MFVVGSQGPVPPFFGKRAHRLDGWCLLEISGQGFNEDPFLSLSSLGFSGQNSLEGFGEPREDHTAPFIHQGSLGRISPSACRIQVGGRNHRGQLERSAGSGECGHTTLAPVRMRGRVGADLGFLPLGTCGRPPGISRITQDSAQSLTPSPGSTGSGSLRTTQL